MIQPLFILSGIALFALRIILGAVVFDSAFKALRSGRTGMTAFQKTWASLAAVFGIALVLGLFSQISAVVLMALVILSRIRKEKPFGIEDDRILVLFLFSLFAIAAMGGGAWSADGFSGIILY